MLPELFQQWLIDPEELKLEEKLGEGKHNLRNYMTTTLIERKFWNSI
jgi:hypothetical protein